MNPFWNSKPFTELMNSDMKNVLLLTLLFTISVLGYDAQSRMSKKSGQTGDIEGSSSASITKRSLTNDELLSILAMKKRSGLNANNWDSTSNYDGLKNRFNSDHTSIGTSMMNNDQASVNSFLKNIFRKRSGLNKKSSWDSSSNYDWFKNVMSGDTSMDKGQASVNSFLKNVY